MLLLFLAIRNLSTRPHPPMAHDLSTLPTQEPGSLHANVHRLPRRLLESAHEAAVWRLALQTSSLREVAAFGRTLEAIQSFRKPIGEASCS